MRRFDRSLVLGFPWPLIAPESCFDTLRSASAWYGEIGKLEYWPPSSLPIFESRTLKILIQLRKIRAE